MTNSGKITSAFLFLIILMLLTIPAHLISTAKASQAIEGLGNTGRNAGYSIIGGTEGTPTNELAASLIGWVNGMILIMGALYMILVIYAGYLWMNSRGSEEEVEKAKKIIIWSTVGIGVIILGRIIAEFVIISLGQASGN